MKKIIFHALLLLSGAALGSCSEELETDVFGISGNTIQFPVDGGTQTLVVDVKCDCMLSCDADWIVCSPQYVEAGKRELTIEAAENPEFKAREATIFLANEELNFTRTIAVRQEGIAYIDCNNELTATYKGGVLTIEVRSNVSWEASSPTDWLTLSPTRGAAGTTELSVELPILSADQKTRQGEIVLSNTDYDLTKKIAVKQTSQSAFLTCSPDRITASFAGGAFSIDLETNIPLGTDIPWKVSCDADWLTVVPERDNIHINISIWCNTGSRKTEIIVSNAEYNVTKKIAVEQTELPKNQVIAYKSSDGLISINESAFDATLLYHEYDFDTQNNILIFDRSITKIGDKAFSFINSLTSITIPDSVTSIGEQTFNGCSNLTSVTIGNGVTKIGHSAFFNCSSLTSITIPNSVTEIGSSAFAWCNSLHAFNGKYASADKRCLIIEGKLIAFAPAELTAYTISNSVTSIGEGVFWCCDALTNVTIGNSVKTIEGSAFSGCSSLTSITIPNNVTEIGEKAFWYCNALTNVTIGNGVTKIGDDAFYSCNSLTSIYCKPQTPPTLDSDVFKNIASSAKIYVPTQSVNTYRSKWNTYYSMIVGYNC